MGTTATPNLGLIKPDGAELASNFDTQHATNMDKIDTEVHGVKTNHENSLQKRIATNKTTVSSGFIGTTDTVVQTVVANGLKAGKTYRVRMYGRFTADAADTRPIPRIREDSLTGAELAGGTLVIGTTSNAATVQTMEGEYVPASDENKTFVVTVIRGSGGNTSYRDNSFLYVDYIRG